MVYFSGSAAGSLPPGHVSTFLLCFILSVCACPRMPVSMNSTLNHCFMSIKHKGKRMCNGVNSLYILIVQSSSLQLLLY